MASISLPRVLQPRKTSLEIERENFEKFQTQSISKAINPVETPVKQKHVRSTIIGTFQEKGAVTFWVVALRLPLQENRIVAWKFCHVLHIILREGHYNCLEQSQRHIGMIEDLGKLWVHLKEGYGKLIQLYATLMITKINFHQRNHRFPGNLQLTAEELDAIGENDINNYFQMSVEIFDYMDDILTLQAAIFDSIDNRTSSMTSSGQCRLAPILPCVQDSNQLYDFSVKLLFRLHSMLPADTLSGHRERFLKQFKQLKKFYQNTNAMQYFKYLITIPKLPSNPPNFLIQSELRTYVPPVVILPPEEQYTEEQDLVGNLIDTSDASSQLTSPDTPSDFVDFAGSQSSQPSDPIVERDNLIEHLHFEISRLRSEIHSMIADHRATMVSVNERIVSLESQLNAAKDDLEHEKRQRSILMDQQKSIPSAPEFEQRILAAEERAKSFEEKFQKLKSAYTQMREEHIVLIRQKAECDKQVVSYKKTATELEASLAILQTAHQVLQSENSKVNSVHVQSANDAKKEMEIVKQELASLTDKYAQEKEEINKTVANLQNELSEITVTKTLLENNKELNANTFKQDFKIEKESLTKNITQLNMDIQNLCSQKEALVKEKEVTLNKLKEEMNQTISKHKSEKETLNYALSEADVNRANLLDEMNLLKKENEVTLNTFKEEMNQTVLKHDTEKETLNKTLSEVQDNLLKLLDEIDLLKKDNEVTINTIKEEMNKTILIHNEEKEALNNTLLDSQENHSKLLDNIELLKKENEVTINIFKEEANDFFLALNNEKDALNCKLLEVKGNNLKLLEEIDSLKIYSEARANALTEEFNNLIGQHKEEKDELQKSLSEFEENFSKLKNDFEQLQKENEALTSRLSWCNNEKSTLECELQDLLQQKMSTEDSLSDLLAKFKDAEIALSREISNASLARWSLMKSSLQSSSEIMKGTIHELDNPAISSLQCGLEYFRSLLPVTGETLNALEKELITYEKEKAPSEEISIQIVKLAHLVGTNVIQGVATSNTSKDIVYGEQMALECRELAIAMLACINYLMAIDEKTMDGSLHQENGITNGGDGKTVEHHVGCVRKLLDSVGALAEKVGGQDETRAGDSVEGELADMEKAIEEAAARIEEMLLKSRAADSGVKLEVNEKILDACTSLMGAVQELVKRARLLQGEIVSNGRGSNTVKEFYKRNHQWTEGLISAAKAIAMGATLLLTSADKVVSSSGGKLEHLMVASQEIAASTAQLVVASRVRAARGSERLGALTLASRAVSSATGAVIATAKACATLVEESEDLDMSGLSWQAGRRLEMESRVRVLELEQSLATERLKLSALRRTHYRLEQSEDADAK